MTIAVIINVGSSAPRTLTQLSSGLITRPAHPALKNLCLREHQSSIPQHIQLSASPRQRRHPAVSRAVLCRHVQEQEPGQQERPVLLPAAQGQPPLQLGTVGRGGEGVGFQSGRAAGTERRGYRGRIQGDGSPRGVRGVMKVWL